MYVHRTDEELVLALEECARSLPDGGRIAIGGRSYSWPEFAEAIRQGSSFGERYLNAIREAAKEGGEDPLVMLQSRRGAHRSRKAQA